MSEAAHDLEVAGVEAALMGLTPRSAGIDRDRLMFRAGQASRPGRSRLWPCTTAVLGLATATLAVLLAFRSPEQSVEIVVVRVRQGAEQKVPSPAPVPVVAPASPVTPADVAQVTARENGVKAEQAGFLKLRDEVLRWGVDALPPNSPVAYTDPPKRDDVPGMALDKLERPGAWHNPLH